MAIEFTDWAVEILNKAQSAAARFNPDARIRLERSTSGVQAALTDEPAPDDERVIAGEMTLFVEAGLSGLIDCREPHDQLVLRPTGSAPNARGQH